MCLIGSMHENGEGVSPDPAEAKTWYGKAGGDRC
jgi:TPR repeat protein